MLFRSIRTGKVQGNKAHRWVGFIQGVLVARGVTSVDQEGARIRKVLGKAWLKSLDGTDGLSEQAKKLSEIDPKSYY